MKAQWSPIASSDPSIKRYKADHRQSKAWVERHPDGSADSGSKDGFLGLGLHTETFHVSPAPSDEAILAKLDARHNPPRFDGWEKQDKSTPGTTYYQGEADNFFHSTVNASITRVGGAADVNAQVGWLLGDKIEAHFFAPAPSDAEILARLSQRH